MGGPRSPSYLLQGANNTGIRGGDGNGGGVRRNVHVEDYLHEDKVIEECQARYNEHNTMLQNNNTNNRSGSLIYENNASPNYLHHPNGSMIGGRGNRHGTTVSYDGKFFLINLNK